MRIFRRLLTPEERDLPRDEKRARRRERMAEIKDDRAERREERLEDDKINTWVEFWEWGLDRLGGRLNKEALHDFVKAEARDFIEDHVDALGTNPTTEQVIAEVAEEVAPKVDRFVTYPTWMGQFGVTLEALDDVAWPVVVKMILRPIVSELYDED